MPTEVINAPNLPAATLSYQDEIIGLQLVDGEKKVVRSPFPAPAPAGPVKLLGKFTIACDSSLSQQFQIDAALGTKFLLTDVLFTNPTTDLSHVKSLSINDGTYTLLSSLVVGQNDLLFRNLSDPTSAISSKNSFLIQAQYYYPPFTVNDDMHLFGNTINITIGTPYQGPDDALVDMYLFGYAMDLLG